MTFEQILKRIAEMEPWEQIPLALDPLVPPLVDHACFFCGQARPDHDPDCTWLALTNVVEGDYFVLKPATDLAARAALATYTLVTENEVLAADLAAWLADLDFKYKDFPIEKILMHVVLDLIVERLVDAL